MTSKPDMEVIRRGIDVLFDDAGTVELRCLTGGRNLSGYFRDKEKLAQAACQASAAGANVYYTINPCRPDLFARCADRLDAAKRGGSTQDPRTALFRATPGLSTRGIQVAPSVNGAGSDWTATTIQLVIEE